MPQQRHADKEYPSNQQPSPARRENRASPAPAAQCRWSNHRPAGATPARRPRRPVPAPPRKPACRDTGSVCLWGGRGGVGGDGTTAGSWPAACPDRPGPAGTPAQGPPGQARLALVARDAGRPGQLAVGPAAQRLPPQPPRLHQALRAWAGGRVGGWGCAVRVGGWWVGGWGAWEENLVRAADAAATAVGDQGYSLELHTMIPGAPHPPPTRMRPPVPIQSPSPPPTHPHLKEGAGGGSIAAPCLALVPGPSDDLRRGLQGG